MSAIILPVGGFVVQQETPEQKEAKEKKEREREARVQSLIERIRKSSPLGRKIIDAAIERGVCIGIDSGRRGALGAYIPSMKYVSLSEEASDNQLLSTIVHECRHSEQTFKHSHENTVYSAVKTVRAIEADAMAHECAAVFQMRSTEPRTYNLFCARHGNIMRAYEQEFSASKDENKALGSAFKAWYDDAQYVNLYDKATIDFMAMGFMYSGGYKKDFTDKQFAEGVCKKGNTTYVEPQFFSSPRATTVGVEVATDAEKVERKHIRNLLKIFSTPATSADYFYIRDNQNGKITPPKRVINIAAKLAAGKSR